MTDYLFSLPETPGQSLQTRIREMLVGAMLDGHIPPGAPLPSGRRLARQLHVARNTVVLAYQQLVDEGYVVARERSGYYVAPDILEGRVATAPPVEREPDAGPNWSSLLQLTPSSQNNIVKPSDWQSYPYPFIYGQFDPALFPLNEWRECWREAMSASAVHDWANDRIDQDDPLLVEQIMTRILPRRGVFANPDEILVTVGAQQAIYIVAQLLAGPNSRVGLEEPGYPDARNIFSTQHPTLVPLEVDDGGLVIDEQLDECNVVYTTPSHQFPTTVTLDNERRSQLLKKAQEQNFILVEDDYESELNYVDEPHPALKSLDRTGNVIYVGSLSKTIAPGLRLGYMVGDPELIREARALRRLMLRHPPANNQHVVAQFLKLGHHDSLLRRLSQAFRERWTILGSALERELPDMARVPGFGGTAYWVQCPDRIDTRELFVRARADGILIEPADVFFLASPAPSNCMRLGFSSIPSERIDEGVRRLATLMQGEPSSAGFQRLN